MEIRGNIKNQKQTSASLVKSSNSIVERLYHQIQGRSQIALPTDGMEELDVDLSEDTVTQLAEYISQILLKYYIPTIEMLVK